MLADILRHHSPQGSSGSTQNQRRYEMGGSASKALVYCQGNQGKYSEVEKPGGSTPQELSGFHHFSLQKSAEKAGEYIDDDDSDINLGF